MLELGAAVLPNGVAESRIAEIGQRLRDLSMGVA